MNCKSRIHRFLGHDAPHVPYQTPASGFKTLLVPLDGSSRAEHALPHALAIARRSGASIRLALVHAPLASTDNSFPIYTKEFSDWDQQQVRQKQLYLNDVARRIGLRDSVKVTTYLSESQRTVEQLCAAAQGIDLVIMATHGWGRWGRLWHGSTAEGLLRRLSCPLLLVRGYQSPVDLTGDPIVRQVLVPLDGSKFAEQILTPAAAIGQVSDASVTLLHVENSGQTNSNLSTGEVWNYLRHTAKSLNFRLPTVSTRILQTDARTAQAVLSFAAQHEFDLVAVTTHARGGWAQFSRDSIADAALQRNGMAVLILRPNDILKAGVLV